MRQLRSGRPLFASTAALLFALAPSLGCSSGGSGGGASGSGGTPISTTGGIASAGTGGKATDSSGGASGEAGGSGTPTGGASGSEMGGTSGNLGTGGDAAGGGNGSMGGTGGRSAGSGGRGDGGGANGGTVMGGTTGGGTTPDAGTVSSPGGDIHDVPVGAPRREGYKIIHSTNVSQWEIHDAAVYDKYKANFDEIIGILEHGYYAIQFRLGTPHDLPIKVIIEKGGCCGGFAGGGDVGYSDGDFMDAGAMDWIRGVVIGEVVNGVTGQVSADWPRDWWADTAWYFPGFVAVDVLKEVKPDHALKWETTEKYPTYPVYVLYKALLAEHGWDIYRKLFAGMKTDKMNWSMVGANPSALKTNYVIAYVSLAAGENLGARFASAKVAGADAATVGAIMDAHGKLMAAGASNAGWQKFRTGDYKGAVSGL